MAVKFNTDVEIVSGLKAVWINDKAGCIGRFGWMGIDVHASMDNQLAGGSECRFCTHGPVTLPDWKIFKEAMLEHHQVNLTDMPPPKWLRE